MNVRERLESFLRYKIRGVPLWAIGLSGMAGVLIDLDHPVSYWLTGETLRAAHPTIGIVSILVLCGVGAFIGRLHLEQILKTKHLKARSHGEGNN